jgi:hypothetical protein
VHVPLALIEKSFVQQTELSLAIVELLLLWNMMSFLQGS